MMAYLRFLRAIFDIVIELIKQNVVIDGVEGFFKIKEYSTR